MSIDITTLALAKEYTNRMVGSGGTGGGVDGKDGITPHIGDNGNWFIGTVDTGISAQGPAGENGVTPHIGTNGNWYIGSVNTGVSAKGAKGDNGLDGNGIKSAILNSDYTLTLTFDDGTTYTTPSIRGATGSSGKDGPAGAAGKDGTDGVGIASIEQTATSTADGGNNVFTVTLTNGTTATFTVKNGSKGSTGKDGSNGVDGGHYTPVVTQPTTDTMQISFAPSKSDMPAVDPVTVNLPVSENSGQNVGKCPERLYVEDYKTDKNTWNDAFDALFAVCLASGRVACTGGTYYALTAPLYIGNIDVDFENCELSNNVAESASNPACVVLTGAEKKIQKFGTVTGRQSVGILVNTATGSYKFNRLHAKLIQGWSGALWLSTTEYTCCFNEFHCLLLKSSVNPLKTHCASRKTKWVNECHFYLGAIEGYRSTIPTTLVAMTNATRCNIYNVDLECGDYLTPNPDHTVEVELTDCNDIAFYNPRTAEGFNAVQFRFVGECFSNFIDAEYSKYRTVDSSKMVASDFHYNVWRGRAVTGNSGANTNARSLRIYKNMIVPETIYPMVRDVSEDLVVSQSLLNSTMGIASGKFVIAGVPTLLKWSAGNITIDKRFIALLPTVIQIMRVSDTVGNILDMDGNVILSGTELELNKRCDIRVDSATYVVTEAIGETEKKYPYFYDISLAIGDFVEEAAKEWTGEETVTHTFVDGFVRTAGTINTTSTNYKYTGLVKYMGGSVDFRAISASAGVSCAIVAFFDNEKKFLGSLETAVGGHDTFYAQYNTGEYAALNGSDIGADVMGGTITAEQIAEWYPATTYIAVSCPTAVSGTISKIYNSIDNPCMATQTY